MRKVMLVFTILAIVCMSCFSQEKKYRYIMQGGSGDTAVVSVVEMNHKLEKLPYKWFDLNTQQGRLSAEGACRNIKRFYDAGYVILMFSDMTKDEENPEISYIDSWEELMMYVRGRR